MGLFLYDARLHLPACQVVGLERVISRAGRKRYGGLYNAESFDFHVLTYQNVYGKIFRTVKSLNRDFPAWSFTNSC